MYATRISEPTALDRARLSEKLIHLSPVLERFYTKSGAAGFSLGVLHHGQIVYTAHFGYKDVSTQFSLDDDNVYYMASLTKAITAAIAIHIDKGQIR